MNNANIPVPVDLQSQNVQLKVALENSLQKVKSLEQQLDWFKRQLFGEKSEKRLIENPNQMDLGELFHTVSTEPPVAKQAITYERRKKQRSDNCETDEGLRFDKRVPVEVIEMKAPELDRADADQYEIIDYKITRRLAQRPGSYVVLEHRRSVVRHKPTQTLATTAAPSAILDRCIADVSLLAGMLVDKFDSHLPLHRQHKRMASSGIDISRTSLTNWTHRAIELLRPLHGALLKSVLERNILAMDETPAKAGRKEKGKMRTAWFWPVYGDKNEVAFTFLQTRSTAHIEPLLKDFSGVLLTDGYSAYDSYCKKNQTLPKPNAGCIRDDTSIKQKTLNQIQ